MPLKLNLGCGEKMISGSGWINVDVRKLVPVEAEFLRHDVRCIREFAQDGAVDEIQAFDVLEHMAKTEQEQFVRDLAAVMRPGGKLHLKTPCVSSLMKWAQAHANDEMNVALRWYGNNDYPENCHRFCWPEADLRILLDRSGFKVISAKPCEDTNILIEAVKK